MQPLATAEQMQIADRAAMQTFGVSGAVLMENAGRGFVDTLERILGSAAGRSVLVACGKGKNGGDGFVIARHLAIRGANVSVVFLGKKSDVRGETKANLASLLRLASVSDGAIRFSATSSLRSGSRRPRADIIVDALIGTGFSGNVRASYAKAIRWINASGARVISVDVPSGVNATSGAVSGPAVRALATVTMGLAKVGLYVGEGREHAGAVHVADIGVPGRVLAPKRERVFRVTSADVASALPERPLRAHKHSVGKIFVLSGSRNFTGAPVLCSQAAMKAGAGAVVLAAPRGIYHLLARKLTEVMVHPLDETEEGSVSAKSLDAVLEQCRWADVVVAGPGLSLNRETQQLLGQLVPMVDRPLILDADGLAILSANPSLLRRRKEITVLTPHVGELSRMTGQKTAAIEIARVSAGREAADRFRAVLVLKGSPTVTAVPGTDVILNSTGNPGMATAGSGDVLSGIIAGLIGQKIKPAVAAWSGVFLHGLAGDLAAQKFGQRGMLALDICDHLPEALKRFEG